MSYTVNITDAATNDARTVEIIRVMYGGRDIDRRMAEYADETE